MFLGQPAYKQKLKQLWKISKSITNKKYQKVPNNFQKIPVRKYKAYTVPKNTGIPGFCENTVPYRTGIKFLIPLGPGHRAAGEVEARQHQEQSSKFCSPKIAKHGLTRSTYQSRLKGPCCCSTVLKCKIASTKYLLLFVERFFKSRSGLGKPQLKMEPLKCIKGCTMYIMPQEGFSWS